MDRPETTSFHRRHLPHWRVHGRPYFVTFRLYGSVPLAILRQIREQSVLADRSSDEADRNMHRLLFRGLEKALDHPNPSVDYLRQPRIAQLVAEAFDWAEKPVIGAYPAMSLCQIMSTLCSPEAQRQNTV